MRISDWSSDVCSSDLCAVACGRRLRTEPGIDLFDQCTLAGPACLLCGGADLRHDRRIRCRATACIDVGAVDRSEEHTSELQSLMRIAYAVFCLKKKTKNLIYRPH